jgi:hypothetical protein
MAERRCSANRVAYGPIVLAQKEARGSRVLTKGLRWTELRRRVVVGEVRAVAAGGARGEGRCRGWSGVQRPWGSSRRRGGADAQLVRAPVQWSDGNTAAQRSGVGRSWWRPLLGFTAARGMDGIRGSAGWFKGASAGISASAPEFGRPASVSAGIAGSIASALRGGDEAGRRGPRVSGGAHCERAERATRATRRCADVRAQAAASAGDALAG